MSKEKLSNRIARGVIIGGGVLATIVSGYEAYQNWSQPHNATFFVALALISAAVTGAFIAKLPPTPYKPNRWVF